MMHGSFRKCGGTLFWGPSSKEGPILESPVFGNSHVYIYIDIDIGNDASGLGLQGCAV